MIRRNMAESAERAHVEWSGIPGTNQELLKLKSQLTAGADWAAYVGALQAEPRLVNTAFFKQGSWSTLLHEAVRLHAPLEFIRELVRLGAFRTVLDSQGQRPVDIAVTERLTHLVAALEPSREQTKDLNRLLRIQELFHGLIRSTMLAYDVHVKLWLPQLSVLTESSADSIWFPIPGMYGGFLFWLEQTNESAALIAESWCRVAGGSGMRHRITPVEVTLEEEGFV